MHRKRHNWKNYATTTATAENTMGTFRRTETNFSRSSGTYRLHAIQAQLHSPKNGVFRQEAAANSSRQTLIQSRIAVRTCELSRAVDIDRERENEQEFLSTRKS